VKFVFGYSRWVEWKRKKKK